MLIKMKLQQDTIQVVAANLGAIGISLADINEVLTTVSLFLAIGFGLYKFAKTEFNKKLI